MPSPMNPQMLNRYAYALNNPLIFIDPNGHWPKWSSVGNFFKGVGNAFVDTAKSTVQMVVNPVETVQAIGHAITHPVETGKAIVSSYVEKSKSAEGIGEIFGEVLITTALCFAGGAGAVEKTAQLTSKVAGVTKTATTLTKTAGMIEKEAALVKSVGKVDSLVNAATNSINLHRPYIRNATREAVENNALKIGDKFVDSNTGKIIEGTYNLGHKYGHEFYKYKSWAESQGMAQSQFNNLMNNPSLYQIESPLSNMSHLFEAPRNIFFGGF